VTVQTQTESTPSAPTPSAPKATGTAASGLRLQLKQAAAFRGGLIALWVVVLVATIAVTAWPRAVSSLLTSDLQHRVAVASPGLRDVQTAVRTQAQSDSRQDTPSSIVVSDALRNQLRATHAKFNEPLKAVLHGGDAATRSDVLPTTGPVFNYQYNVQLEGYGGLENVSTLTSGRWPKATDARNASTPIEIVLSSSSAKRMGWKLDETRVIPLGVPPAPRTLKLVGTLAPHETADFWRLDPLRAKVAFENLGDAGFKMTAVAWVAPEQWLQLASVVSSTTTGWYGVNSERMDAATVGTVQAQLARFLASPPSLNNIPLHFTTHLDAILNEYVDGAGPAQTLLLLLAVGPLGVAIAVLFLGIELLVERRRSTLALLSARGASGVRIRGSLAIEALVVSLLAAAIAVVITLLILPGRLDSLTVTLALLCALVPPAVMAALGSSRTRAERVAARGTGFARWRWVVECVVVAAAVISVLLLVQRGLAPSGGSVAADPLVVATPLLVCLAASVAVLRAYPPLLGWVAAVLRRRRGATGFLGAVRGERTSAATLIPVLAVLVGIAVTVFSSVIFSTERTGIQQASRGAIGADISVTSSRLTPAQIDRMRAIDGVADLATVASAGYANLEKDGTSQPVFVLNANTEELARLQADLPAASRTPAGMADAKNGRTQMLIGGWDADGHARDGVLRIADVTLPVHVASTTAVPGEFIKNSPWVLLDTRAVPKGFHLNTTAVTTALVRLDPGANATSVQKRLRAIAGANAVVDYAGKQAQAARSAPIVGGLEGMLVVAIGLAVLLCVLALVLTLVSNAVARQRLTATLRTLGFSRRQNAGLTAWEIAPTVCAGLIGGLVVGFTLPFVVVQPLNLAAFTGGSAHPTIAVDAGIVSAAIAGFIVVCAISTVVALIVSNRRNAASILRTGEDE
jgi:putative ABC transport system permease protein